MLRICFNLTFDETTEHAVRRLWQRTADVGITVGSLTGYRPHITLAVYEATEVTAYETGIATLANTTPTFPIRMDSLGIFPEAGVIFLAPRMSRALFLLHRAVLSVFEGPGKPSLMDEHLLPDRWVPHCTLAGRLTAEELLTAVGACRRHWTPIHGRATGIGLRIYPSPVDHYHYPFRDHHGV